MTPLKLGKRLVWWWCQDDVCDCTQPQIEEIVPNPGTWSGPDTKAVRVEDGPFVSPTHSSDADEREAQKQWAKDACAKHGIPYHEPGEQPQ